MVERDPCITHQIIMAKLPSGWLSTMSPDPYDKDQDNEIFIRADTVSHIEPYIGPFPLQDRKERAEGKIVYIGIRPVVGCMFTIYPHFNGHRISLESPEILMKKVVVSMEKSSTT